MSSPGSSFHGGPLWDGKARREARGRGGRPPRAEGGEGRQATPLPQIDELAPGTEGLELGATAEHVAMWKCAGGAGAAGGGRGRPGAVVHTASQTPMYDICYKQTFG